MAEPQPNSDSGRTLPRSFGRFEVIDVLGRGGMATVYLAIDPVIGRKDALKVLRLDPALSDPERHELRARFVQEFRAAGTLTHPNLVTIYDVCTEEDTTFIAMEHIEGESLRDIVKSGRELTFHELTDLATQLCSGLDYAHAAGIVHRDIKPSNILLTKAGKPVITDFGVAKAASETSDLTEPGVVVGTPHYMSPEQVTGQTPSGASDQFSLAVILYQLVAGQLPFTGTDAATILYRIVHHEPIPPSQLNLALPAAAEDVLLRALAKDRARRFANCMEFAEALCNALGIEPPSLTSRHKVAPAPPKKRAQPPRRRFAVHPVWPALLIVTGLLAGLAWYQAHLPEVPIDITFAPSLERSDVVIHRVTMDGIEPGLNLWLDGQDTGVLTPDPITVSGRRGQEVVIELRRAGDLVAVQSFMLGNKPAALVAVTVPKDRPQPIVPRRRRAEPPPSPAPAPAAPATADYTIYSNPPGAHAMLNGQVLADATPVAVELTEGRLYTLALQLDGYATQAFTFLYPDDIEPRQRSSRELRFTMAPSKEALDVFGVVRLPTDGYAAELRVAGKVYGPAERLQVPLPPGTYNDISVRSRDVFLERSWRKIEVRAGEAVILELPPVVQVRITTEPPGARVSIDGFALGYAPLSRPLAVGRHPVRADWPDGSRTVTRKVTKTTTEIRIEQR